MEEPRHMTLGIQVLAWDRKTTKTNVREYRSGN